MPTQFYAIVMAGGSGKRFWPLSRHNKPKQLLRLINKKTLIQESVERLFPLFKLEEVFIITNIDQIGIIREEVKMLPIENILGEPIGRDTSACVGYAAIFLEWLSPGAVFCVLPSDHYILQKEKFQKALLVASKSAEKGGIVTIGIKPTYPATGYGYIQKGTLIDEINGLRLYKLKRFAEKPDSKSATRFIDTREFYWNSGIFIWKTTTILNTIKKWLPGLYKGLMNIKQYLGTPELYTVLQREYEKLKSVSIDYGIMERVEAENVVMLEADFEWDDVGSFIAVAKYKKKDDKGNVIEGVHCAIDTEDSIIFSDSEHMIGTIGLKDIVIVHTKDATLICTRNRVDDVRKLADKISEKGYKNLL